jgi:hypothetical protein
MLEEGGPDIPITQELELDIDDVATFATVGGEFILAIHDSSHGAAPDQPLPSLEELNFWRDIATAMTADLSTFAPEWFASFWRQKIQIGVRVPRSLKRQFFRTGMTA